MLTWDQALQNGTPLVTEAHRELSVALMIANIYFPDLVYALDRLSKLDNIMDLKRETLRIRGKSGTQFDASLADFESGSTQMKLRRDETAEKIFDTAKEIRRGRLITWLRSTFLT